MHFHYDLLVHYNLFFSRTLIWLLAKCYIWNVFFEAKIFTIWYKNTTSDTKKNTLWTDSTDDKIINRPQSVQILVLPIASNLRPQSKASKATLWDQVDGFRLVFLKLHPHVTLLTMPSFKLRGVFQKLLVTWSKNQLFNEKQSKIPQG